MATALQSRHRPPRPDLELASRDDICFRHPAYVNNSILLTLPRVDSTSTASTSTFGVHHKTALLACQIIAGNAFTNSYLSLDKAGQQQVQVPLDGVLIDDEYYFIVEGLALYPIIPSFQDWKFPHGRIPDWWHPVNASPTRTMDCCSITNAGYAIDEAHLVPQEERVWYWENEMDRYGVGMPDIDNSANLLPLRKDMHYAFDARWFVILPKMVTTDSTPQASSRYIAHITSRAAAELWPIHHNTIAELVHPSSRAYLFARFAWVILFRAKPFIIAGYPRHTIRVVRTPAGTNEYRTEYCSGADLQSAYGGGGSKAATPQARKRRSTQASTTADQDDFTESSGDGDTDMSDMDVRGTSDWVGWGGKRRQESSEETAPDLMPPKQFSKATAPTTEVHLDPALEVELRCEHSGI